MFSHIYDVRSALALVLCSIQLASGSLFPTQSAFPILMSSAPSTLFENFRPQQQQHPQFLSERELYHDVDISRFMRGYDVNAQNNAVERIDKPLVELPTTNEMVQGHDRVFNYHVEQFPQFPTTAPQPPQQAFVKQDQEIVQSMPDGITEQMLYANLGSMEQFTHGYGGAEADKGGKVERINMPEVLLPEIHEERPGEQKVFDVKFPDETINKRVDNTKEIHKYTEQKRVTTVLNRNIHRYLKTLLVNTTFNTNVQQINHEKEIELLINQIQAYHEPKLVVQYARQDVVKNLPEINIAPVVNNLQENNVLPSVILPATVERLDYSGKAFANFAPISSNSNSNSNQAASTVSSTFSSGAMPQMQHSERQQQQSFGQNSMYPTHFN